MADVTWEIQSVEIHGDLFTHEHDDHVHLVHAIIYEFKVTQDGILRRLWFDAPKGFKTDYYSYPFISRSIPGKNEASVGHDRLYHTPVAWDKDTGQGVRLKRETCDKLFHELMIEKGTGRLMSQWRYRWVQAGGWVSWLRHRKAKHGQDWQQHRSYVDRPNVVVLDHEE